VYRRDSSLGWTNLLSTLSIDLIEH